MTQDQSLSNTSMTTNTVVAPRIPPPLARQAAGHLKNIREGMGVGALVEGSLTTQPPQKRKFIIRSTCGRFINYSNLTSFLPQMPMDITRRLLHEAACTSGGNTACFHLNKASVAVGAKFHAAARLVQSTFRGFMIRKLVNRASQLLRVDLRTHPIHAEYPGLHGPDLHDHLDSLPPWSDPWGGDQGGAVLVVRILQTEHLRKYLWVFKSLSWLCGPDFGWLDPTNGETPWLQWELLSKWPIWFDDPHYLPLLGASQPVPPQPPCDGPQHHSHRWERWEGEFEASWASWWNGFERGLKNRAWVNEARARSTQVKPTDGLRKRDVAMLKLPTHKRTREHEVLWAIEDLIGPCSSWPEWIRKIYWMKKLDNKNSLRLVTFGLGNGLPPHLICEWLRVRRVAVHWPKLHNHVRVVKDSMGLDGPTKCFYWDLRTQEYCFMNGLPRNNLTMAVKDPSIPAPP
jgi:hypothetical protein